MKPATILSFLTVLGTLAAGGVLLAPSFAADGRQVTPGERQWLSIPQLHDKLEAAGYRHIEKIERERGGYEVRATDRTGERVKLYVNPQTGEVSDQRGHGKRMRDGGDEGRRDSADCNKGRCRDDLPQKPATATPAAPTTR